MPAAALRRLAAPALLVLVAVAGSLALASITRAARAQDAREALDAEFAALRAEGLVPDLSARHADADPQLERARGELDELVGRVRDADEVVVGLSFGAPGLLDLRAPDQALARVEPGLRARAGLLSGFADLPDELWQAAPRPLGPDRIGSEAVAAAAAPATHGLDALRSATNLLCAQAWYCAREPEGGAEAGRWLTRAVALARLGDRGDAFGLMLRSACESIVLRRVERLCAESIVDPEALRAPVRVAFARGRADHPLRDRIARELSGLEARYRAGLRTGERLPAGPDPHLALEELLDYVRFARTLLAGDLEARRPELAELEGHDAASHGERTLRSMAWCLSEREALAARVL